MAALLGYLASFIRRVLSPRYRAFRALALTHVSPGVRRPSRARILGYRKNGAPIWSVAGADPDGTATLTLDEERTALLARLAAPGPDDDVAELTTQATELQGRIEAHNAAQAARAALAGATVTRVANQPPAPGAGGAGGAGDGRAAGDGTDPRDDPDERSRARESVGRTYVRLAREAGVFEDYAARGYKGSSMAIEIEGEVRALFDTANNPQNFPRVPGIVIQNDQPLQVIDLVDRQPMSGTSIEWVQEVTAPNAAAEVAHGAVKPEASFSLAVVTDTAATIAHWVSITRQALEDDNQLRGYIEGRLTYGLMKRVNGQIINGNGTSPNLRGILNVSGIGTYTAAAAGEAALISIRKAKTVAELSEYEPDSVVLNPVDWEAVELSADTTGQWRLTASAAAGAPMRVWGLAVVSTTAITGTVFGTTGGTFLVGAFRAGATLWERTGVNIYLTDSHGTNFTSNILTLLAELRAALTTWRPKAFVKGTFGASRV